MFLFPLVSRCLHSCANIGCSQLVLDDLLKLDRADGSRSDAGRHVFDLELVVGALDLAKCDAVGDCKHDCADFLFLLQACEVYLVNAIHHQRVT